MFAYKVWNCAAAETQI